MILGALANYYDRLAADPGSGIPAIGYSHEQISYALVLSHDGQPLYFQSLLNTSGKTPRPRRLEVPLTERTSGIRAKFLWDNTSYVLGHSARSKRVAQEHASFLALHEKLLANEEDAGLRAVLLFLRSWKPEDFAKLGSTDDVTDTNIVFRLDGELDFIHDRQAARAIWEREFAAQSTRQSVCLLSGQYGPIADLHPAIKGVRDAQSSGAYIVSFNASAFTSYGKDSGANAPVSADKTFAYTLTLNHLLRGGPQNRQKAQIADSTTVFWAEAGKPEEASFAEALGHAVLSDAALDEGERIEIESVLREIAKGTPLETIKPEFNSKDTRFYVLGLSPNAARIAVRFWQANSFDNFAENFRQHFLDLKIEPLPWKTAPSVWRLLLETAVQRKPANIPPTLGGAVTRGILTGTRYPHSLFSQILMRLRADASPEASRRDVLGLRVAILKACLVRHMREIDKSKIEEDYLVSLNREEMNPAYRLGRLFAVLENTQRAALGNINATIRDRFYGSASATPAAVFPMLIRNANNHLAGLRKGRGAEWVKDPAKAGGWYQKEIGSILEGLGPAFPRSFTIEDQGRFAIGYYHQRFWKAPNAPADIQKPIEEPEDTEGEE